MEERAVSPSGGASTSLTDTFTINPPQRKASPVPPITRPRESLDGETIFAVGEGDDGVEWSDGEEEDERKGLTRKISPP